MIHVVLTALFKIQAFWDITLCQFVDIYLRKTNAVGDFRGYAYAKKGGGEIKVHKHEVYKLFRYVRTEICYFPTYFILSDDVPVI
jgi:hypothetical protein